MLSLDVGCGFIKGVHQKKGDIRIDLYRGVCDIIADAQNLLFRDNVFEKVWIFSVLEHLNNPMKCLQDTIRVAKDGADFEIVFPVESRECIVELRRLILEFPFGVLAVLAERYNDYKHKPPPHKNRIKPHHISGLLEIQNMKIEGSHAWFQGKKGKLLRMISKNPPKGGWVNWHIKARKVNRSCF